MSKSKNKQEIYIFNDDGLKLFRDFIVINSQKGKGDFIIPSDLLTTPGLIEPLSAPRFIDLDKAQTFSSRYDLSKYLFDLLHQTITEQEKFSQGIWEWLTLFYFSMFVGDGNWKLRRMDNYIYMPSKLAREKYGCPISPNYDENVATDSRHCIRASYLAYEAFGKNAKVLLEAKSGPAYRGEMAEQLLSRRWIKDYPQIMEAAMKSSMNSDGSQKPVWLVNHKGSLEPGSLRSYIARVDNFMYSHNFDKIDSKELKKLLGAEFN